MNHPSRRGGRCSPLLLTGFARYNALAYALCIVFLFAAVAAFSQAQETIKGLVRDSTGKAVPYASINLWNKTGNAVMAYATTDAKGTYALRVSAEMLQADCYLEARCVGYKNQIKTTGVFPAEINFILPLSYNDLDSVVVRGRHRPVLRTSGDTISYKAADFSSAQDRVIGDVIKRLPGITVAEDGTIRYNNHPISGIYIGGDNLLDDKYSIAANTIPNGVVDQVQVIDNHQPIKVLQNKVTSNDVAINLTFTKAKLRLIGQEALGAGLTGNYYADLNALLLKDHFKAINYLKANNTGEDLQRDMASHNNASNQNRSGYEPPEDLLSVGSVNNPDIARQRYLFNRSAAISINDLINLANGMQLRVNASWLADKQQQRYNQQTGIFLPTDTIRYNESQDNWFNPRLLHTQFTLTLNKEKIYLNNTFTFDDNRSAGYSALNTNAVTLGQVLNNRSTDFSNEFNLIRAVRSRNIFEVYSFTSHLYKPEDLVIAPGYSDSVFNHGNPYAQLMQDVNTPTWFTNNFVSYKIPGEMGTASFKTGLSLQSQKLLSGLRLLRPDNTVNFVSDSAVNDAAWNKRKFYAEAAYDIPLGKLTGNIALPFMLQQFFYADESSIRFLQLQQQGSIDYNPSTDLQLRLSGEYYFTRRNGNADLKYFFADASAKFRIKKWNTDLQLKATNFLNVKTYNTLCLSVNSLTASSYTLPGSVLLLTLLFNL